MATDKGWSSAIDDLEQRLGGRDEPRPWPPGWEELPAETPARIGVVAAALDFAGGAESASAGTGTGGGASSNELLEGRLEQREAETFPAASTMKVYVLQALLEAVAQGRHGLDEHRSLTADDAVTGSGVLKLLTPGTELTLLDIATLMITVSDNTATNMLIDLLGIEAIRASVAAHGWGDTYLRGKLQQSAVVAGSKSSPSHTSARDLADYFSRLWLGQLLPPDLTEVAKQIYRRQQFTELGRSLHYDSYSAEIGVSDMVIASKSGSIRGVRNDAGVFEFGTASEGAQLAVEAAYVVVVLTDGCPDRRFHADNLGARIVGEVAATTLATLRS